MTFSRRSSAVAAVYLGTFMATLAISIVSVALPSIQADLKTDIAGLQWIVGSYALALASLMLSAGPLGDRYGRKRAWLSGVVLFSVGSAVCACASSLGMLIVGSVLQGVAGALVIPGALSILTQAYPDPVQRAHVIGGWSSFSAVSLILGPILGGLLVDNVGWPSIYLINVPLGVIATGLGLFGIEETSDPSHAAFDPPGQLLSIVFLGALTYALITAGHAGWTAAPVGVALIVAAIAFVIFILVEMRMARPVLPIDLFRFRTFASANFASFVLGFSGYTSLFLFSLFLQQGQGWSATEAGWRMGPVFVAMAVFSSLFGRLSARYGSHGLMLAGYLLIGASMLTMATFSPTTPYAAIALLFSLLGAGLGLAVPSTSAAAMAAAPRERTGSASATMNALRQAGMTIGIALLGTAMGARAISSMVATLAAAKITDATALAATAVRQHELPEGLSMTAEAFRAALARSFADGFSIAATIAGTLAIIVPVVLFASIRQSRRREQGTTDMVGPTQSSTLKEESA